MKAGDIIQMPSGSRARVLGRIGCDGVLLEMLDWSPPRQMTTTPEAAGLRLDEFLALGEQP